MLQMVGEEHKLLILLGKLFYHKSLPLARNPHFAWGSDRYSSNPTQFSFQREEEMVSRSPWLCILEEGQFSFDEGGLLWRDCQVHVPGPVSDEAGRMVSLPEITPEIAVSPTGSKYVSNEIPDVRRAQSLPSFCYDFSNRSPNNCLGDLI